MLFCCSFGPFGELVIRHGPDEPNGKLSYKLYFPRAWYFTKHQASLPEIPTRLITGLWTQDKCNLLELLPKYGARIGNHEAAQQGFERAFEQRCGPAILALLEDRTLYHTIRLTSHRA